jgi:AraC family transcriptional regulator
MKEQRPRHLARPRQGDKNSQPRPQSVGALVTAVNAERVAGFPSGRQFLDSVEQALAVALVEGHAVRPRSVPMYRGGLTPARLRRVTELVHAKIEGELTLHEIAQSADVS